MNTRRKFFRQMAVGVLASAGLPLVPDSSFAKADVLKPFEKGLLSERWQAKWRIQNVHPSMIKDKVVAEWTNGKSTIYVGHPLTQENFDELVSLMISHIRRTR